MKRNLIRTSMLLATLLSLGSTSLQAENLIQNGSFENFDIVKDKGKWKNVTLNSWEGQGKIWTNLLGKPSTDGEHKLSLDAGKKLDELSQIVSTVEGKKYKLSLDAYRGRVSSSDFQILVDGTLIYTVIPDGNWAEYSVYFLGTGGEQVISLKELESQNDGRGAIIDNVRLEESTELIVNGSFEDFSVNVDYGKWKDVTFDAWEGKAEVWDNRKGIRSTKGAYKVNFDFTEALDVLSQTVNTENKKEYALSLDVYVRRLKSSDLEIWVDDTKIETFRATKTWQNYTFKFYGNGKAQKIQIKEVEAQNNGFGAIIDNVSMVATGFFDNLAQKYGKATQGGSPSYRYYAEASLAIDGNISTNNHTDSTASTNWWQVELPNPTLISKIMIQGHTSNQWRLEGASVYIMQEPYTGTLDESNKVATLLGNALEQVTTFTEAKSGRYLLVKAAENKHLHLVEVEVYGEIPTAPILEKNAYSLGLEVYSPVGTVVGEVSAFDYQEDNLDYSIVGNVPFSIDNNGSIILSQEVNHNAVQSYAFKVNVSDGINNSLVDVSVKLLTLNGVKSERWNGVSGSTVSDLLNHAHYQDTADEERILSNLDFNEYAKNYFGERLTATLKPSESGEYIFAIVGNNGTQLNLNGEKIAYRTDWSAYQNWSVAGKSKIVHLEAGNLYFMEAFVKENNGGEHISVGWKKVEDEDFTLIPSSQLYLGILDSENVKPAFNTYEDSHLISGTTANGTVITTVSASDFQGDTLTYSIVGDVPFSVDSNGNVSVNGTLAGAVYSFDVLVSDGANSVSTTISIEATSANAVQEAMVSGSVLNITEEELIQATLDEIEASKNLLRDAKIQIFNLNSDGTAKDDASSLTSIDWNPTHDSSLFLSILSKNTPLLVTNAVAKEGKRIYKKEIGIIGEKGTARYMVMGANPLRVLGNEQMEQVLENSMAWLTGKENLKTAAFSVVIAHLDETYWSKDESKTRLWLDRHYAGQVSYNTANSCDGTALAGCLANSPDLLIISQLSTDSDDVKAIASTVNQALKNGTSVLYIHQDGNQKTLGKELFSSVFNVMYIWDNYDKKLSIDDYNPIADLNVLSEDLIKIKTMFSHFKNKDYSFDWRLCQDSKGVRGENKDKCHNVTGLGTEFQDAASVIRTMFNQFDSNKKNIFLEEGYRLQKLLALTSDKFRQTISFPMDKVKSDDNEFMKSYYSDHAVYNYRKVNPAQADMGNFSRSDFSHITPITKTVNLNSKKNFRSVGLYALPGQTVKVTRNDSSEVSVKVFINTLRSGSTHQYERNGYKRPKYLQSPHFEIKSAESIEFTSPYGGPLQLQFSTNDLAVELTFENVGEHAYWASTADDASFAQKLQANEYDWAEVATGGFEVHSTLEKMIQSVASAKWGGTAAGLAAAIVKYTSNYPHVLAGFKGDGVDVVPEIHDWANTNGLTIETIDIMKHMNADQATCGGGCSGNPYDAYWAFSPIGHGDIHELGHSLQKKRFEGFPNHAATNTFSYYTKSKYFENTGGDGGCGGLPFKSLFDTIQGSVGESNVTEYLQTNLWDTAGLGEQYLLKIQAMMHAQKLGKIENGWHVLARVHILEREKNRAKADWEARKASIGFSTYSLSEFNSIRDNDWLVVSYSYAATLDYRNYFDMMGIPYSQKARDQIASFGFDVPPNTLFVSTDTGYCKEDDYGRLFDRPTLAIDGSTSYAY